MRCGAARSVLTGAGSRRARLCGAALFGLRSQPRDTFSRGHYSRRCHLGARYFLDLTGRASSVIDHHALTKPQADDILLAPDMLLLGLRRRCKRRAKHDAGKTNARNRCNGGEVFHLF